MYAVECTHNYILYRNSRGGRAVFKRSFALRDVFAAANHTTIHATPGANHESFLIPPNTTTETSDKRFIVYPAPHNAHVIMIRNASIRRLLYRKRERENILLVSCVF